MENLEKTIIITDEKGNQKEGQILFTFESNGDNFVLYELENKCHAAKIDEEDNLLPVEEDEWKYIEKIYSEYIEEREKDE